MNRNLKTNKNNPVPKSLILLFKDEKKYNNFGVLTSATLKTRQYE
jgi:hypothetical protein